MPALARKLRLADYFALAFGAMVGVGVGWLVLMDDWLATCLSFWLVEPRLRLRLITGLGIAVSLLLLLMKLLPAIPGHFTPAEWLALGVWLLLGLLLHRRSSAVAV